MKDSIIVFASSRQNGNTRKLIDCLSEQLKSEVIDITKKNILPFDYQYKNSSDDFVSIMRTIINFEKVIYASPVYWNSVCAQMKLFIDRHFDYLDNSDLVDIKNGMEGKSGFIACTSTSDSVSQSFLESFVTSMQFMGLNYNGYIHINCEGGYQARTAEKQVVDFVNTVLDS